MEAKDLMIGDLVRVNRDVCIKNDTIVRVCGIDATNRLVEKGLEGSATCVPVDDIDFYSGGIWVKYLSPIPITQEILEKNKMREFEHRNPGQGDNLIKKWWHKDGSYYVSLYMVGDKYTYTVGNSITRVCRIRYVHELQHALRLCGIDKEIVVC